jgi:hypothetical protein
MTALRLPPRLARAIQKWASGQDDEPNRSEAIRRLIELGLANANQPSNPRTLSIAKQSAARAAELAEKTIEKKMPADAPPGERAERKRKLLEGPSSFRDSRKDRSR